MTESEINKQIESDELEDSLCMFSECNHCYEIYLELELNGYGLCSKCEEELQDEKNAIKDTEDSLQNFR